MTVPEVAGGAFREEVHEYIKIIHGFHETWTAEIICGEAEALCLEVHVEAAILAVRGVKPDAEVSIERDRTGEVARGREVATKVLGHKPANED